MTNIQYKVDDMTGAPMDVKQWVDTEVSEGTWTLAQTIHFFMLLYLTATSGGSMNHLSVKYKRVMKQYWKCHVGGGFQYNLLTFQRPAHGPSCPGDSFRYVHTTAILTSYSDTVFES